MAERKKNGGQSSNRSEVAQKRADAERVSAEQKLLSMLDDPAHPDQASPMRGVIYFAVIVLVALLLNLAVMIVLSGGR